VIVSDAFGFADPEPVAAFQPPVERLAPLVDLMSSFSLDIDFSPQPNFPK
jgi:hypothetical protein